MVHKEELSNIVGPANVFDDLETIVSYSSDQSFVSTGRPWYVVKPGTTEEIQGIVKWANANSAPLIPVSSPGGPRFHGDTIPAQGGVIVDLSGMNKVLNIDRKNKIAMVEPGVTFEQLDTELRKNNLRALKPLLPRRTKSVIASYLEREPIVIPKDHWDAADPLSCIEVVFGTGDTFRTGSASGPGTISEQLAAGVRQVNPSGPGLTSLSRVVQGAQGTMGIVTWATVFCGLLPKIEKLFFIPSENLSSLIELTYKLLRHRIGEELFLLNAFCLANIIGEKPKDIQKIESALPPWILVLNLTGNEFFPDEKIKYQEKDVRDLAQSLGLELMSSEQAFSEKAMRRMLEKPPERYYKLKFKGGCQDIFFITTLDRVPGFVLQMHEMLKIHSYSISELGVYIQPTVQGCSCHCEFLLMYDPSIVDEKENIKNFLLGKSIDLVNSGAFLNRPYWPWSDLVYKIDKETTAALKKVKGIFDPNGIMNPGKLCF